MDRAATAGLAILFAALAAWPASAATAKRFWAKPDTSGAIMARDYDECAVESKDVRADYSTGNSYNNGGVAGVIGTAIGEAIVSSIEERGARAGYIRRCMRGRGYAAVVLSADELAGYQSVKTPGDRAAWADRAYAAPGLAERLRAAMHPPVPPLPAIASAPGMIGALRMDPAALSPAMGTVTAGGAVLTGSAGHRLTARVREAFPIPGQFVKVEMPSGGVMQATVAPSDEDANQPYWCGVAQLHSLTGLRDFELCFWVDDEGYAATAFFGRRWLVNGVAPTPTPLRMPPTPIVLDVSADDLLGQMDLSVVASKIGDAAVTLEARATRDGKSVVVWSGDVAFGPEGKAVLPCWSHRLVLARSGSGLTASYPADGDGTGWTAAPPPR